MPHKDPAVSAAYHARYRRENKVKIYAASEKWRKENLERSRASARKRVQKYRQTAKGKKADAVYKQRDGYRQMMNAAQTRWREKHPDRVRANNAKQNTKPSQRLAMKTDWKRRYARDPAFRIAQNLRGRINYALRAAGSEKAGHFVELIGCTPRELKTYLESQFLPGMTWENRRHWHIDHRIPCVAFNLKDPMQQLACFHFTNLQPLWAKDNLRKGAKSL